MKSSLLVLCLGLVSLLLLFDSAHSAPTKKEYTDEEFVDLLVKASIEVLDEEKENMFRTILRTVIKPHELAALKRIIEEDPSKLDDYKSGMRLGLRGDMMGFLGPFRRQQNEIEATEF